MNGNMNGNGMNGNGTNGHLRVGWDVETHSDSNGHDVTSALEIPGDDMAGALVRAVPIVGSIFGAPKEAVSVPGDTYWKGALGQPVARNAGEEEPPPPIDLICIDGDNKSKTISITWDMSWSDVLDQLRIEFKRACVFSYDATDPQTHRTRRNVVASEDEFDEFCSHAELYGNKYDVYIVNASFKPSEFIRAEPNPILVKNGEQELALIHQQRAGGNSGVEEEKREADNIGPMKKKRSKRKIILDKLEDAPYPLTHTMAFGASGLVVSCAAVILGYMRNLDTLAAVALALPVNIFALSFYVSAVEDGAASLIRLGVGFCGFFCAMIVICCYSITRELVALGSAFLFLLASFWYLEITVKARGWTSWFQGLHNLWQWFKGGCPLVGIRTPEEVEEIIMIGEEPPPTFATFTQTVQERHPGVKEWVRPQTGMKVKHVGQCLMTLSEKGNPKGPWEEGIIHKKTARQLRKWLVRNGGKTEADFKRFEKYGAGKVKYTGPIGTEVEWESGDSGYYETGEDHVYELMLFAQEAEEAPAQKYMDGLNIHSGGSKRIALQTFLTYFMPKFCAFLWYWTAFLCYFLMLYTFEYSLTNFSVYQAVGGTMYQRKGGLYPTKPGNDVVIHIHCKGVTQGEYDGRPPVIMESMEGIGQGIALARLQDLIAQRGIACVYDRVGFGFSSDMEDTSLWTNRTPDEIVNQLHFALTNGQEISSWDKLHWIQSGINDQNETIQNKIPVNPPFVMLGHSAGGLYARLFASRYPDITAGLVLVDPLPAEFGGIPSIQQKTLSPFLMTLCTRFLQPVGLMYTFLPSVVSRLFTEKTRYALNQEDNDEPLNDFQMMTNRMFERQWCKSVYAEWNGLYTGDIKGIESVAKADRERYQVPTLIWVRDKNRMDGATSQQKIYEWEGYDPAAASVAADDEGNINGTRRRLYYGRNRGRRLLTDECEGCFTWDEVQLELLKKFDNAWINPFTARPDIMKGDKASCAALECSEYTPLENAREIYDGVLDMWNMLGKSDTTSGSNFTFVLAKEVDSNGRVKFNQNRFKCDLSVVLRHARNIRLIPLDEALMEVIPITPELLSEDPAVVSTCDQFPPNESPFEGYSGDSDFGTPSYIPRHNEGVISFIVQIFGHKERAVGWAQDNLRGTENRDLDSTAVERRTTFLHQWQVLSITETFTLVAQGTGVESIVSNGVDLFSSEYSSTEHLFPNETAKIYKCPQNSYRDGKSCFPCAFGDEAKTAATGALSIDDCFACFPTYDDTLKTYRYFYLNCTGRGCAECPEGTLSSAGALGITDCRPIPGFTFYMKGPMDPGQTSQAVEEHRTGRDPHRAFDSNLFRTIIARITDVEIGRIMLFANTPRDVPDFPASRCTHLRGGCMFQVGFTTMTETSEQLERASRFMLGMECTGDPEKDALRSHCMGEEPEKPDLNRTKLIARRELLETFEVVAMFERTQSSTTIPTCPATISDQVLSTKYVNIFSTDFSERGYECPTKFYRRQSKDLNLCVPCPDMTTSDAGAEGITECAPFNTFIIIGKDPSFTYQARTLPAGGGLENAQPSALDLHKGDVSYIKIRGYAVKMDNLVDESDTELGFQWQRCSIGLNCFNAMSFREHVSELVGKNVQSNEVRLIPPFACKTEAPGVDPISIETLRYTNACGPWPGIPSGLYQCACTGGGLTGTSEVCYVTGGRFMIGDTTGGAIAPFAEGVGTAGKCAEIARKRLIASAFLYDPNSGTCQVVEPYLGSTTALCPSSSRACIDRACEGKANNCPIVPGMQLYWYSGAGCTAGMVKAETMQCQDGEDRASQPMDLFHLIFNLHAETATELERATNILTGAANNPRNLRTRRADFLDKYKVMQLNHSNDKMQIGEGGVEPREGSLRRLIHGVTCGRNAQLNCENSGACSFCLDAFGVESRFLILEEGGYVEASLIDKTRSDTVTSALVTRIDITVDPETMDHFPVSLLCRFSDGNERELDLSVISYDTPSTADAMRRFHAFYIEPVVTHSIRITPVFRDTALATSVRIALIDLQGHEMSESFSFSSQVNLFQSGFLPNEYKCPSTTTRLGDGSSCTPCAYPKISNHTGAGECYCPACGDGRLNWQVREQCDDGNMLGLDGCDNCTIENLQMCEGEKDPDTFVGIPIKMYDQPDECLRLGSFWTPYGPAGWKPRFGTTAVVHKDAMWVIGGIGSGAQEMYNDVWFEDTNGWNCIANEPDDTCVGPMGGTRLRWGLGYPQTLQPKIADYYATDAFPPRGFHGALSKEGYIWVTGGLERGGWQGGMTEALNCPLIPDGTARECQLDNSFNDVWRTSGSADAAIDINRVSWELVTRSAAWTARGMHGFVDFKGKMWVIGGREYVSGSNKLVRTLNDVWSSSDGRDWSVVTLYPAWRSRAGHGVSLDQDSTFVYLTGGRHDNGQESHFLNDVWRSSDMITWHQVTAHANWHGRWLHRSVLFQNSLWVIGGQRCHDQESDGEYISSTPCTRTSDALTPPTNYGDVWVSVNAGVTWFETTAAARWNHRAGQAVVVFDTQDLEVLNPRQNLWLLGGMDDFDNAHNASYNTFAF
eukprot:CAMPEP_0181289360 /NCGR_PEP_ID=MMETSP1101-20121128/842_1 /TAXON_ID=46948 /ORGANISM="Rhodomonas abbreviata, Strain Caron Lab Isolate" /LENGTH=2547 /DNA_ID=CAMNT_0023393579 /DNA_START=238 /DNA_END=7881 /DNA_ORIENTATION=-